MLPKKTQKPRYSDKYPKVQIQIYKDWCIKCALCAKICQNGVIVMNQDNYPEVVKPEECAVCYDCAKVCPGFAITLLEKKERVLFNIGNELGGMF